MMIIIIRTQSAHSEINVSVTNFVVCVWSIYVQFLMQLTDQSRLLQTNRPTAK